MFPFQALFKVTNVFSAQNYRNIFAIFAKSEFFEKVCDFLEPNKVRQVPPLGAVFFTIFART